MNHFEHRDTPVQIKGILFDAYGTLVEITVKRAPFRRLLQIGERQGRRTTSADAVTLMTAPLSLGDAAKRLGIPLTAQEAVQLERDLRTELDSVRLFADTLSTLGQLRTRGYTLGLCSNLAAAYAAPVIALLQSHIDVYVWSFEAGAIKPDPQIYARSCQALGCFPDEVLMIGDTRGADVTAPRAYGMHAVHLDRRRDASAEGELGTLSDLPQFLDFSNGRFGITS